MKNIKKIAIFAVFVLVVCMLMSVTAFAAAAETEADNGSKLDMNLGDPDESPLPFEERVEYALQGTATGMLMVFGVLGLLTLILYGSKYVFYDLPNKNKERAREVSEEAKVIAAQPVAPATPAPVSAPVAITPAVQDDGELAAVITAAIAAMIESGEYKNEFVGGFRVVSFKRNDRGAWNRK